MAEAEGPPCKSPRMSPYSSPRNSDTPTTTTTTPTPTPPKPSISLEAFLSNLVYGVVIQDDEEVANLVFDRSFGRELEETANGQHLTFDGMKEFTANIRKSVSDRRLVSESFVVVIGDPEGKTGTVAHSFQLTGIQDEGEVKVTIVSVVNVGLDEEGQRKIKMESFVFRTDKV